MNIERKRNPLLLARALALAIVALVSLSFTRVDIEEYEAKAMFLINFVKYIDWGQQDPATPVRIGIVGHSEIRPALERIAEYKKGNARPLQIVSIDPAHPELCHVIFISREETRKTSALAKELAGKGVLLVTEDNSSSNRSAGINLIKSSQRIKFEINQPAIRLAGLRLSGQLQQLAAAQNP